MAHIIRGDRIIVRDGTKFFLAECDSATLRGEVKTYKRSALSYARKVSPKQQVFPIESEFTMAACDLLAREREKNEFADYPTIHDLRAALAKLTERLKGKQSR